MSGPNNSLRRHIFQSLVTTDETQKLMPELATSWRAVDDKTWEFKLRPGVKFTNGADFSAKDVVYTLCRIPTVENSPSPFTVYTRGFEAIETPDPLTVVFKTTNPTPLLPNNLSTLGILSAAAYGGERREMGPRRLRESRHAAEIGRLQRPGEGAGTGPYKLANYTRGTQLVLERNDAYWGDKPHWQKVTWRPISSEGPRVAALLAGDVDVIENPPIQDFDRIKRRRLSDRAGHLEPHHLPAHGPVLPTRPGRPRASRARTRTPSSTSACARPSRRRSTGEAIVERIMGGVAVAAGELLPDAALRHLARDEARRLRSGGRQEAPRRGRLPERLRGHARHARTTATSTTRRWRRRRRRCSPASASRRTSTR